MRQLARKLLLSFWLAFSLGLVPTAALAVTHPPASSCGTGFTLENGIGCGAPSGSKGIELFGKNGAFKTIANTMLIILGAISIIMIIIGGFRYVLSGGNSTNINGAKDTIMYALIGLVVALLAGAFVNFVINKF